MGARLHDPPGRGAHGRLPRREPLDPDETGGPHMTRVAVIGCGLIGRKRLQALPPDAEVVALVDLDLGRAEALAASLPGTRPSVRVAESIEAGLDGAGAEVA